MNLASVILGPIVTEKSERLKAIERTHAIKVAPKATKIDIKNALRRYFDVDVSSVRVIRVHGKTRRFGRGSTMEKRHPYKKALVTLTKDSKNLDLASFRAS